MKIALMLTGLARKVEDGYKQYWSHIIENYDVDLYLHAWKTLKDDRTNNENSDVVSKVYKNPKYIKIENPFSFKKYTDNIINSSKDKSRPLDEFEVYSNYRSFPMFYSWQSTYKEIYKSNVKYECVIRSRYDISGQDLYINELDLSKINVTKIHHPNGRIIDDNFCITSKFNSDIIFSDIFDNIVKHHKNIGYINSAEQIFTDYLERKDILKICNKTKKINFKLLREDKVWY